MSQTSIVHCNLRAGLFSPVAVLTFWIPSFFVVGAVPCTVGHSTASLASTRHMPVAPPRCAVLTENVSLHAARCPGAKIVPS